MAKTERKVSMPAGIRNKMMAAVSMLLVSSIMMVSSTYAWFTLSTAPEVKNISTTVAGNGSLEIALMPTDGSLGSITSGFSGDSANGGTVAVTTANTTWGNIINLSDPFYGLSKVELNPARFNIGTEADTAKGAGPLAVATYGFDGRIDKIIANTTLKNYDESSFKGAGYGVRAIGEVETDGTGALGNTYGYVVDLAFRLNTTNHTSDTDAAGKLLLQTEEMQRIYSGENASDNSETLGGGSYMSFNVNETGLDEDTQLKELMKAIRVTFVQDYGNSGTDVTPTVLGTAKLDTNAIEKGATEIKAPLYLYETGTVAAADGDTDEETGTETDTETGRLTGDSAVLVANMQKNAAVQVSAIVWLDGDMVTNSAVASLLKTDSNGARLFAQATLNLQFATDVELTPANNNALYQGSAE